MKSNNFAAGALNGTVPLRVYVELDECRYVRQFLRADSIMHPNGWMGAQSADGRFVLINWDQVEYPETRITMQVMARDGLPRHDSYIRREHYSHKLHQIWQALDAVRFGTVDASPLPVLPVAKGPDLSDSDPELEGRGLSNALVLGPAAQAVLEGEI